MVNRISVTFKQASSILAILVITMACLVEIGWWFDITLFKSIFPGIVSMNPLTAVCFILTGLAVLTLNSYSTPSKLKLVRLFASIIIGVGVIRMIGIVFGIDIPLDQAIFHEKIIAVMKFANNRIAPNTSINLILTGVALLLTSLGPRHITLYVAQFLSFLTVIIALFAILGYAYSVKDLYGFLAYTPMAFNTALAFLLVSLGLVFVHAHHGFMRIITAETLGGVVIRRLVPAIVLIPGILGWLRLLGQDYGYYGTEYGSALLVCIITLTFFLFIYGIAKKLHELDTERRQAQAKDEAILGSIGDSVFAIDSAGTIILFNKAAAIISGYSAREAIGNHYTRVLQFVREGGNEPSNQFIDQALSGKKVHMQDNTQLIKKDGSRVAVADTASPLTDLAGTIHGAVIVFRDVTQERQIDRAKDEFISLASHQLRTPLTAIRLYSEMLEDSGKKMTADQKDYLSTIHDSTIRMTKLVQDILNLSRIQLGTLKIVPEQMNMADLIKNCIAELKLVAQEKKVKFTFTDTTTDSAVYNDPSLLRQIIHNLLTNAMKYSPENGGTVDVRLSVANKKTGALMFSVEDHGIGIPKSEQTKIFERFFRADNAIRTVGEGTGLGLYIAKMIVDEMKGSISFRSTEGTGTTFYVTIPVRIEGRAGQKTLT